MPRLFVDTGAFYATADRSDRYHAEARAVFEERGGAGDLVTTDHVVMETWLLINARMGRRSAMRFWDAMTSGVVSVLGVTSEDLVRARAIANAWLDQNFSIVDCSSFSVIERTGIREAFAFDRHFRAFRTGRDRTRPLVIVP